MGAQGNFVIRKAEKKDACLVLEFIRKIAEYERMSRQVVATRELLEEFVFDRKAAEVLIGEAEGRPVGFALYFENFSTFLGRTGLHLEDLFVDPKRVWQAAVSGSGEDRGGERLPEAGVGLPELESAFYRFLSLYGRGAP